jgi:hypothetical protein
VQRVTVYNHFPDDVSLLAACSAHWRSLHPAPGLAEWAAVSDPEDRLRLGLGRLYAWYRETEPMTANVLRDAEVLPELRQVLSSGLLAYLERARQTLAEPWHGIGDLDAVNAAVRVVVDFHCWRSLASLGDERAADLAARFVAATRLPQDAE